MKYPVICAILALHFSVCLMFNILKDDVPTDRMEFCVGERITFVCPKQSTVIAWTAPPILMGEIVLLSLSINFVSMPPFNATNLIGRNSTLTVDVFSQLDGVNISCFDRASTGALLSTTIVQVLGGLFIPVVTTVQNNISSLNLTITQPGESALCVRNYNITVTSMGSRIQQLFIDAFIFSYTAVVIDNLQLCIYNYTLQVVAISLSGSMSEPFVYMENITTGGDIFIPVVTIVQNDISSLNLTITQPGESAVCVRDYKITVTSMGSTYQQSVMYAVSSPTNVVIGNLQLCLYNYTVQVVAIDWSGNMSEPFVDIGNITPRSNLHLSNLIFEMSVLKWSIPPELMDCIAGYEYSFQYSGVSGALPANTTTLSLDMLNISTPCNVDYLTIAPLFHMQPQPIRRSSIMRCISTASELSMTTGSLETTREIPFGSPNQYQFCVGAIIGIILMGVVIIFLLAVVIAVQAVKIKELKSKTIVTQSNEDSKFKDAQYDEVKLYKRSDKLKTRNLSEGVSEIAMVGCQAYGTVSVQQSLPGVGERSAGVYEAV